MGIRGCSQIQPEGVKQNGIQSQKLKDIWSAPGMPLYVTDRPSMPTLKPSANGFSEEMAVGRSSIEKVTINSSVSTHLH